jgi:hypothetical protein
MPEDLQESIADEMNRKARVAAALFMVRDLTTEDIELVNKHFPHLAECAHVEILNPNIDAYGVPKPTENEEAYIDAYGVATETA